jgi:hypothetical protein
MKTSAVASLLVVSAFAAGCMPQQTPPPATSSSATPSLTNAPPPTTAQPPPTSAPPTPPPPSHGEHASHVYRLDFVLTGDPSSGSPSTSFTLNLMEHEKGSVHVGKNVPLSPPPTTGIATTPAVGARQDVGLKVAAQYRIVGDDLLLEVSTEMSSWDPPSTIRKISANGNALATPGKQAIVMSLDEDKKHYQLAVTATKLR